MKHNHHLTVRALNYTQGLPLSQMHLTESTEFSKKLGHSHFSTVLNWLYLFYVDEQTY